MTQSKPCVKLFDWLGVGASLADAPHPARS